MDTDQRSAPRPTPNSMHRPARTHARHALALRSRAPPTRFVVRRARPGVRRAPRRTRERVHRYRRGCGVAVLQPAEQHTCVRRPRAARVQRDVVRLRAQLVVPDGRRAEPRALAEPRSRDRGRGSRLEPRRREHRPGWQRRRAAPSVLQLRARTANMLGAYNQVGVGVVVVGTEIWVTFRFANGSLPKPRDATPPNTRDERAARRRHNRPARSPRVGGVRTPGSVSRTSTSTSPRTAAVGSGGWIAFPRSTWPVRDAAVTSRSSVRRAARTRSAYRPSTTQATRAARRRPCRPRCRRRAPKPMPFSAAYAIGRKGEIAAVVERPDHGSAVEQRRDPRLRRPTAGWRLRGRLLRRGLGGRRCTQRRRNRRTSPAGTSSRGIALNPDGKGGYVLDGFGGVWPFGNAEHGRHRRLLPAGTSPATSSCSRPRTATKPAGYVMDALGRPPPVRLGAEDHPGRLLAGLGHRPRRRSPTPTAPAAGSSTAGAASTPSTGRPTSRSPPSGTGWDIARGADDLQRPERARRLRARRLGRHPPREQRRRPSTGTKAWPYQDYARYLTLTP